MLDDAGGDRIGRVVDLAEARGARGMQWLGKLARNDRGAFLSTEANAMLILGNDPALVGLTAFNEFKGQPVLRRAPPRFEDEASELPGPYPRPISTEDVTLTLGYFQRLWAPRFSRPVVDGAMMAAARHNPFHPVRDWLATLAWDGKERIDGWLSLAFGCPDDAYHAAVGSKFLVAAVRRVRRPGCKFDSMLILEGDQDLGKSRACKALFGEEWFSDSLPHDLGSRDAAMALLGVWGLEIAELEALLRTESEPTKAFLSRSIDRYRAPWGKAFQEHPRQGVLVGTTNQTDYLRDSTGNRRYWPVRCQRSEADWVAEVRDQLWAEAAAREAEGEPLWLDDTLIRTQAIAVQAERLHEDSWTQGVEEWLVGRSETTVAAVLQHGVGMPRERMDKRHEMRAAAVLRSLGWVRVTSWNGGKSVKMWARPQ